MSSFERIGLEDLQDLAESFANMSMVDLKMMPGDGSLKPRDQQPPPPYYQQQQQQEPQFQPHVPPCATTEARGKHGLK